MLGHDLMRVFPGAIGLDISQDFDEERRLDITQEDETRKKIIQFKPRLVINAAAYTDVDGAETKREIAMKVNSDALIHLSAICAEIKAHLVHFSTDYVFDGKNPLGYTEDAPTNPINWYGVTKARGEAHIQQLLSSYHIIRTSWLFGMHGRNFVFTILKLAAKGGPLRVVNDQVGCPTYSRDLAVEVKHVLSCPPGIYHVTNQGCCSWFDFAKEIIKAAGIAPQVEVIPIKSSQFPLPAVRPRNSILNSTKRTNETPSWKEALRHLLFEIQKTDPSEV